MDSRKQHQKSLRFAKSFAAFIIALRYVTLLFLFYFNNFIHLTLNSSISKYVHNAMKHKFKKEKENEQNMLADVCDEFQDQTTLECLHLE